MSFLSGILQGVRNFGDDIGSVITGQPAHGPANPAPQPQPQFQQPQAPQQPTNTQGFNITGSNPNGPSPFQQQLTNINGPSNPQTVTAPVVNPVKPVVPFKLTPPPKVGNILGPNSPVKIGSMNIQNTPVNQPAPVNTGQIHLANGGMSTPTNTANDPVGNFVGGIAKPLGQFPIDAANQIYNRAIAPTLGTPNLTPQQTTPIAGISNKVGATGSLHQTVGSGIQTALTLGSGGLSKAIEKGGETVIPKVAPQLIKKYVPKIVSNAGIGYGFGASSAAGAGAKPSDINKAGLQTAALGGALPAAGMLGEGLLKGGAAATNALRNLGNNDRTNLLQTATTDTPVQNIPINSLHDYEGTAPDRARVDQYKQQIASGQQVDPLIALQSKDGTLGVEDGKHRLQAYKELGYDSVPTQVTTPDRLTSIVNEGGRSGTVNPDTARAIASDSSQSLAQPSTQLSNGQNGSSELSIPPEARPITETAQGEVRVPSRNPNNGMLDGDHHTVSFPEQSKLDAYRTTKAEKAAQGSGYSSSKSDIIVRDDNGNEISRIAYDDAVKKWGTENPQELAEKLVNGNVKPSPETPTKQASSVHDQYDIINHPDGSQSYIPKSAPLPEPNAANSGGPLQSSDSLLSEHPQPTNKQTTTQEAEKQVERNQNGMDVKSQSHITPNDPEFASLLETEPQRAWDQILNDPANVHLGAEPEPIPEPKPPVEPLPDNNPLSHAANAISDESIPEYGKAAGSGTQMTRGRVQAGVDIGRSAGNYIREQLPKAEDRIKLQLLADGSIDPASVSPKVRDVFAAMKPIYERAGAVRQELNPDMHLVEDYAPRMTKRVQDSVNAMLRPSGSMGGEGVSPFDNARTIRKFVDQDGNAKIGSPESLDIAEAGNGKYYDTSGNEYTPTKAKQAEIVNAGAAKYQLDAAKNIEAYVADTMRMVEHNKLVTYLKSLGAEDKPLNSNWVQLKDDIPGLEGMWFDPKVARNIESFTQKRGAPAPFVIRAAQKTGSVVKDIGRTLMLDNPIVHPLNMEANAFTRAGSPVGMARFVFNQLRGNKLSSWLHLDEGNAKYAEEMHQAGGASMGMHSSHTAENLATKYTTSSALQKLGIAADKVNPLSINHAMVGKADEAIRVALYRTLRERGLTPVDAASQMNKALVDYANTGDHEKQIGKVVWFYPWLKGNAINAADLLRHPIANKGNLASVAVTGAMLLGAQEAWRQYTGNKHATIRFPGIFGIIKSLADAPGQAKQGQVPGFVTGRVNPFLSEGLQQYAGKDQFSKQPITNRLKHAENTFIGNSNTLASGNKSPLEKAGNIIGLTTPHAKGTFAAPAKPDSPINIQGTTVNGKFVPTQKAADFTVDGKTISDPTGIDQQKQHFIAQDAFKKQFSGPNSAQDQAAAAKFLARDKTPDGKTIELSQEQTASNFGDLAGNRNALAGVQKYEQTQGNHSPQWDLSGKGTIVSADGSKSDDDKIRIWAIYKSLPPGDLQKNAIAQYNPWISDTQKADADWAQKQTFGGNVVQSPDYVQPPQTDPTIQTIRDQITQLSSIPAAQRTADQIAELKSLQNNPDVQASYQAEQDYTNAVRQKWGLTPINYAPAVDPKVQDWTNAYMGADKATRKQLKANNPDMFNQMEQSMENQQLAGVEKQGGIGYYSGKPANSFLGDIQGLGKYDISSVKNANGTTTYALTNFAPSAANSQFDGGINTTDPATAKANGAGGGAGGFNVYSKYPKKMHIRPIHVSKNHKTRRVFVRRPKTFFINRYAGGQGDPSHFGQEANRGKIKGIKTTKIA